LCRTRLETAWLFHEIGNCFLVLGDFEYAKQAAKKSLFAAEEAVEWNYQLQSSVLVGVAEGMLLCIKIWSQTYTYSKEHTAITATVECPSGDGRRYVVSVRFSDQMYFQQMQLIYQLMSFL
jgi:hypothetical protein